MKIQTITRDLNFKNINYNTISGDDNNSRESNSCKCNISVIKTGVKNNINIIISADIVWFTEKLVENLRNSITEIIKIDQSNIVFCASHTHGSPFFKPNVLFNQSLDVVSIYLEKKIFSLFKEVIKYKPISVDAIFEIKKASDLSINRRRKSLQFKKYPFFIMQSLPNKIKKIDNVINIIKFIRQDNKAIECILVKYTCHPVSDPEKTVGADYPGYLRSYLNEKLINNLIFLQGFCGDIRPKLIKKNKTFKDKIIKLLIGDRFRKSVNGDSENIAKTLSTIITNNSKVVTKFNSNLAIKSKSINFFLPLDNNSYSDKRLEITIWIWDKICFLFISAEVLSSYRFKNIDGFYIINVGYSNGMLGYLPTVNDIKNGGYEVDKSRPFFGLNERVSEKAEELIKTKIYTEIRKLHNKS
jgi:hypothetical protein